jgi:hypothetical protein
MDGPGIPKSTSDLAKQTVGSIRAKGENWPRTEVGTTHGKVTLPTRNGRLTAAQRRSVWRRGQAASATRRLTFEVLQHALRRIAFGIIRSSYTQDQSLYAYYLHPVTGVQGILRLRIPHLAMHADAQ